MTFRGRRVVTLTRSWGTPTDGDAVRVVVNGHPCPGPRALDALRRRVHDVRTPLEDPIRWWHSDSTAWAAVNDLHRRDLHGDATSLALLLRWCETSFGHDDVHVWTLAEEHR